MADIAEVSADQLKQAVESQHGGRATLADVLPIKEVGNGQTIWEGVVQVFDLDHHPRATRAYAWSHLVGVTGERRRFYAVLHLGGVRSPLDAVWAATVAERRSRA
jgi:hypothetical protein